MEERMSNLRWQMLVAFLLAAIALVLGACTRSASTPPPNALTQTAGPISPQQATMDAVRSMLLTETAAATLGLQTGMPEATTQSSVPPTSLPTALPTTPPTPTGGPYDQYTAEAKECVYSIACRLGIEPQIIISLNKLKAPYFVKKGTVLWLPGGNPTPTPACTIHVVKSGEWIYSIARKYGVEPSSIILANCLTNASLISPGDRLIIP
jgi:LysM repeat protein